jgi:hypothetical protein
MFVGGMKDGTTEDDKIKSHVYLLTKPVVRVLEMKI